MRLRTLARRGCVVLSSLALTLPVSGLASPAGAAPAKISPRAFGLHYLTIGHPKPLAFGSARVWDMGVGWKDLQPTRGSWSSGALANLDNIVSDFRAHGAEPMITLGMTPHWAATACHHRSGGVDWGYWTCAPKSTSSSGAWGSYVRMLAKRYQGKVRYFELWNEPSLRNGYNGSIRKLAGMQAVARRIVHQYGAKLVSPGVPFTNGSPQNGLNWLQAFLSKPGGKQFDVVGLHLYPTDAIAKAGYGPEWTMEQLAAARKVLRRHHITKKQVWNTEVNVGRAATGARFTGRRGAAQVARTFVLGTQNHVARTFWYAADDRSWGGTWLENSSYRSLTDAGRAYRTARNLLVGARPYGCSRTTQGAHHWRYTCRYHLANGKNMLAVWSTGGAFSYHGPRHTSSVVSVVGGRHGASMHTRFSVGGAPLYVIGTFPVH
jgi:hypothetical protein